MEVYTCEIEFRRFTNSISQDISYEAWVMMRKMALTRVSNPERVKVTVFADE